ncbi:hypothetical protein [Delftia acidovorans]|jgi:hypothetical protein|uniref:hypothetical protein n=1 Tax=Delftia acidovorans TaxID=80866 RepID=UPI00062D7843|nr:hypothetical protein [Delftia acidovorans]
MSSSTIVQTITPAAALQCAGLDLHFAAVGGPVIVVLSELDDAGMPGLAAVVQRLEPAQINTAGQATRVTWPAPVLMRAKTGYAICISAADTQTALEVAQVGEASQGGGWVTAAQAEVGQMLEINASGIVTRHANRMLRFELLAVQYTASTKTVTLGTQAVVNATSLMLNAGTSQPEPTARISYALELLDAAGALQQSIEADVGQPVKLAGAHTGSVRVRATLRVGDNGLGAVLDAAPLLLVGSLLNAGTYITPSIASAGGTDLRVVFVGDIPAGAAVAVHAQLAASQQWQEVPYLSSSPQTAGSIELTHRLQGINTTSLRLRLTLTGTTTARPKVRDLRAVIL